MNAILILIAVLLLAYWSGYLPYTSRYYERRMDQYYFGILHSSNCDQIEHVMRTCLTEDLVDFMDREGPRLQLKYPLAPLQAKLHDMQCRDDDGSIIDL